MTNPTYMDAESDDQDDDGDQDEPDGQAATDEPNISEVDLSDDEFSGGGDLFDGVEEASTDGSDDADSTGIGNKAESLESTINQGAARAAVIGLDDSVADDLETEFQETFEAFRLGFFGAEFAEEYVFVEDGDEIDPAWGLLGSALLCMSLVVWMRPDGDQAVDRAKSAVSNLTGGQA